MAYYNPFQGRELKIPQKYRKQVEVYCQTRPRGGRKPSPTDSPFPRHVDIWFLAVCVGARNNKRIKLSRSQSHKFITGEVLANDADKIELLEILGIAVSGDPYIIGEPAKIVEIANEYAVGGLPIVLEALKNGKGLPLDNIADYFYDFLS